MRSSPNNRLPALAVPLGILVLVGAVVAGIALAGAGLGLAIAALGAAALVVWAILSKPRGPIDAAPRRPGCHIIVIAAGAPVGSETVRRLRRSSEANGLDLLIVAPALNSPARHWLSDLRRARRTAEEVLDRSARYLAGEGFRPELVVGDSDLVTAAEDALRGFPADLVILSTGPLQRLRGVIGRRDIERLHERSPVQVDHVTEQFDIANLIGELPPAVPNGHREPAVGSH